MTYSMVDDRRLPTGGPLNYESYGPSWLICRSGAPMIIILDPGDGSEEALATKILSQLNSEPE